MILSHKNLLNLPVETKSGQNLGTISHFDLEADEQRIFRYYVKSSRIISGLLNKELIISAGQVVSINEKKMIVEDSIGKEIKITQSDVAPVST